MCTLIVGRDVVAPGVTVLGANRDEDPVRPSDPPGLLAANPRVVGGRDRVAGGTWLAVRRGAAIAMLNRRPAPDRAEPPSQAAPRSRGLLALEIATQAQVLLSHAASDAAARVRLADVRYAPFSLVVVTPHSATLLRHDGNADALQLVPIASGWHVLTHTELDDPAEPRTARLLRELHGWAPRDIDEALDGLRARLAQHDPPAVCLHEGRMRTVSYALVALSADRTRYLHGEGRPCVTAATEYSAILEEERNG